MVLEELNQGSPDRELTGEELVRVSKALGLCGVADEKDQGQS